MGLPVDAAVHRYQEAVPVAPQPRRRRQSSSLDEIRKIGGNVIEIHRDKAG